MTAIAVIMEDGRRVELANIEKNGLTRSDGWDVSRVLWADGGSSWGKAWSKWSSERQAHVITRIGAGAYGDMTIYRA